MNISVQMAMGTGTLSERFAGINLTQVAVATVAGALSGGVSAIANGAATTGGTVAANVIGNAAVAASATQVNAQLEGRTASASEVAVGALVSGATGGSGAAESSIPSVASKAASAGMTQRDRLATTNLLQGIKDATPGFKDSNQAPAAANAFGMAIGASGELKPLIEEVRSK
ncbi:MAG: hypothetical protein ACREPD_06505 [Stenotrophomonas sp.]|uniref:hypothetical protein n=1 Tax=Stenotrophomonas sp. TaxID=69392 RepID=UPI003D6CE178